MSNPSPTCHPGERDCPDLEECPSRSTSKNEVKYGLKITRICATGLVIKLRRMPLGFYVIVKSDNGVKRTSIKPTSVREDVVRWEDEIALPLGRSSKICFTVFASFELGPTLGNGEVLREVETTVGKLLDSHGQRDPIRFVEHGKNVNSPGSSLEIQVERRVYDQNKHAVTSDPLESEEMRRVVELTDIGHRALNRYRELHMQRDLEESVKCFELAQDLCSPDHPNRSTVLFNLATARLIYCRETDTSPNIDVPIRLYRDVLRLRPRGHPDHAFTLLSLAIALQARLQRQHVEADGSEGRSLLSQVLDAAPPDSYTYHAAALALGSTAKPEQIPLVSTSKAIRGGDDYEDEDGDSEDNGGEDEDKDEGDEEVQRLDAALQWIFLPDSSTHMFFDHLGILFCIRPHCLSDLGDPEQAISTLDDIVQFAPDDHPDKPAWLDDLGVSLWTRYQLSGDRIDLDKSILMFEDAERLTPDGHPDKPSRWNNLSSSLSTRYEQFDNIADLERSISLKEAALKFAPDDYPDRPLWLNNLGNSLSSRFERSRNVADLDRSISLFENALFLTPDGDPNMPSQIYNLSHSLSTRYECLGNIADLQRSILLGKDVLELTPDGHPKKSTRLNNLSLSLKIRYERFRDVVDLEQSISLGEDALKFAPDGYPDKPLLLHNLSRSLFSRYERFGDIVDMEKSISLGEDALRSTPDGHPDKPLRSNNLGKSLSARFARLGDAADLDRSISLFEDSVKFTPDNHADKFLWLNNLASSLSTRYRQLGDISDLERSISMLEGVVQFTPDGHADKPTRLDNLSISLSTRYERFGDVADLERAILLVEDAVKTTPDGDPDKPTRLNNLGNSLSIRYQRFGDIVDLEKSMSTFEDAVRLTPHEHPGRPLLLNNLGGSLWARYRRFGDIADLEKSVSLFDDVVQLTPDGHPEKAIRLNNLSQSLYTRYWRFGDLNDLERSISLREVAVKLTPDGHPDKPMWLNSLGRSLLTRHTRLGDIVDLERSIALREDAVRCTPDGHPDKLSRLHGLGISLAIHYGRFKDTADLEKSMSLIEDVVRSTPDGHPDKPLRLSNLGDLFSSRYSRFGDAADIEKSISLLEDALQSTPDGDLGEPFRLNSLARSLLDRFKHSGSDISSSDLARALSYSSRAARSPIGSSVDRFQASQTWIQCARLLQHDSQSLLDAYTVVVHLLPQLAWIGLSLHDRYYRLLRAVDGACEAAAVALEVRKPALAVEWLEQGRSVVWNQLSQLRSPVDDLRAAYPDLADQFERVSRDLEYASARDIDERTNHSDMVDGLVEKQAWQYHALAVLREKLLAEIRALPGFDRFLLPKTVKQLSSLARSGPVVFLNASKYRCDALVVMVHSEHVVHIPLPDTNYDEAMRMKQQLTKLSDLDVRHILDRGSRVWGRTPDDVFRTVLSFLWKKVVNPILKALGLSAAGSKLPRIFWCPTGPFSYLPIHAAGLYGRAPPGSKLSDFTVSSYIPTMSALELLLHEDLATTSHIRLLAVAQPSTDGQTHLTRVREEIGIIEKLASSSPFVDLQEADGTVEDVLSRMMKTDWVHFACHGTQDRANPYNSGFLLANGKRLTLSEIARLSHPHGGLAFLAACQTATGDEQFSEEAIHIAAGMLLAGYRGVIGTMWSIVDGDAPKVAEHVYKSLFGDGQVPDSRRAAEALHNAIERLRDSGVSFLSWVPFIHVGV